MDELNTVGPIAAIVLPWLCWDHIALCGFGEMVGFGISPEWKECETGGTLYPALSVVSYLLGPS